MPDVPPGRPIRNDSSSQTREKHQVYLLLVLGVDLLGAGAAALGLAARSVAAVGIGAGAMVAAGLLSVFFASWSLAGVWTRAVFQRTPPQQRGRRTILILTTSVPPGRRERRLALPSSSRACGVEAAKKKALR